MGTLCFFDETIRDQGEKTSMDFEFGRSSYYDEDSLYIKVDDKLVIVNRKTAKKILEGMEGVGRYLGLMEE